jgi:hypothetical protein
MTRDNVVGMTEEISLLIKDLIAASPKKMKVLGKFDSKTLNIQRRPHRKDELAAE